MGTEDSHLPARIADNAISTLRPVNPGAEKWLHRPIQCLDHGFVYLVDYMGHDDAITQAARVSYGKGTKKISEDRGLIRYLMRHSHTTPLEMCELKFHCKLPIFVARQWIRHRTASVNEYSGRYSEMLDEFYVPEPSAIRKQSAQNRQGRGEELTPEQQQAVLEILKEGYGAQFRDYKTLLDMDVARELARIGLSVGNYTQWYWKIDLHNLFHFLRLRLDAHAQHEIQVYGKAMAQIVKDAFPLAYEAFEDYQLNGIKLSAPEIKALSSLFDRPLLGLKGVEERAMGIFGNKRETEEFIAKLQKMNFVDPQE